MTQIQAIWDYHVRSRNFGLGYRYLMLRYLDPYAWLVWKQAESCAQGAVQTASPAFRTKHKIPSMLLQSNIPHPSLARRPDSIYRDPSQEAPNSLANASIQTRDITRRHACYPAKTPNEATEHRKASAVSSDGRQHRRKSYRKHSTSKPFEAVYKPHSPLRHPRNL